MGKKKMHSPAAPQESPTKSFHCTHCPLIFKSKIFLFEHLNDVHSISVDTALRDSGLFGTNKDNSSDSSISAMECQEILEKHEKCDQNLEDQEMEGSLIISESPEATTFVMSASPHRKAAQSTEISSEVTSTSQSKCTQNLSKDLKTYRRPPQTIAKYFKALPGSDGKTPVKSSDNQVPGDYTKGTIILQESPSITSSNSSGVFKVTAKPMIDLSEVCQRQSLILIDDLTPVKPQVQIKEPIPNNAVKRTCNESLKSPLTKTIKMDNGEVKACMQKYELRFEVSEDEEEKMINPDNGDMKSPEVYFCKHCDYSDVSIQSVSTHYENDHPYVRYTSDYIQDPSDQTVSFRCLECPVDFIREDDLKKHYTENHPEAPDVFTMSLNDLHLVFKCFVCPFTNHSSKALREHYREMHPAHKVSNLLMYCRYSVTRCQEESCELNTCEKTPSSENIATENGPTLCEEVQKSPPLQHSTSKVAGVTLFQCNNCNFSHKSVVVMHVHYQKSHPEEAVTIDKIKQTTPRKMSESPNSVSLGDKSTPQIAKTKNKAKTPEQKSSVSLTNTKHTPETSKTHSASSKTKKVESSDNGTPAKCDGKLSSQMGSLSPTSPNTVFYCQFCSYSSINIRSVVCHQNSKHSMHELVGIQEILKYTAEFHKKCQSEAEASASISSSTLMKAQHPYARAEDLFYCHQCNFGNPTIKGIMGHQAKVHRESKVSNESIIEHTAMIRDEIEKLKSQAKESSFSSYLPLPLLKEGDECNFFCYLCNYRQKTVSHVVNHFLKLHRGFKFSEEQIHQYTSKVLEMTKELPLKATSYQEVNLAYVEKKTTLENSSTLSASSSKKASQTQKAFQCQRCTFRSQDVYLLKRHIRRFHRSHNSVSNVLNVSIKKGKLQSGYRCELCVFFHKKATTMYNHYQEKHPEHGQSLKFITTRLYVGPGTSFPKKKKPKIKPTDGIRGFDGSNERRSGQNETQIYRCRACSFKGHSVSSITHHYRAVHPWSVKEDGSVLDVINTKKPNANKQLEDFGEEPESFDAYQAPLEFDNLPDSSDEATPSDAMLKCPHCPSTFHTKHGLITHRGMKHYAGENSEEQGVQRGANAFKCPHCTYVNNNHHGVLTHCQMRHPMLESRAESLHVQDWDGCSTRTGPDGSLRFSGYMCNTCSQIHTTPEKLYKHFKEDHSHTGLVVSKPQELKTHNTLRLVSKGSSFHKKTFAVVRCRQCDYRCTTKIALRQHMVTHHKNAPISQCIYKCAICYKSYFRKKSYENHYSEKHGMDAFVKYHAPVYEDAPKNPVPTSPDFSSIQVAENSSEACQPSTATKRTNKKIFKCPSCPYVNASKHGTLTHCQMKHPEVIVRADKLETDEIPVTSLAACTMGKGSNERGYICIICSQIHASWKRLKIHIEIDHHQASEHSTIIKDKAQSKDSDSRSTKLEADTLKHEDSAIPQDSATEIVDHRLMYRCPQCPYSSMSHRYLASHYTQKHKKKASPERNVYKQQFKKLQPPSSLQKNYKCDICSYNGLQRRYLWRHYKVIHNFDSITTCMRLHKYNKVKNNISKPPQSESEDSAQMRCVKCTNLLFDSVGELCTHYSSFHSSDCKTDFTVLYAPTKSSSGVYRCCHCKKQMNGIKKLCLHLDQHRERIEHEKNEAKKTRTSEVNFIEPCLQDEPPVLDFPEDPAQRDVTQADAVGSPTSPLSSPSKPADAEQLKTLDDESASALKHIFNKYLQFKSGTLKPFMCSICHYQTIDEALWRCHFIKQHQDIIKDPAETDNHNENTQEPIKEPPNPKPLVTRPESESRQEKHTCKQCARTFMSLRGLRCHESSHAAVAAIKKLDNLSSSALKCNFNKYVVFKPGTLKPFLCSICHYRTTVMALWKRHFMKNHQDVIMDPARMANRGKENTQVGENNPRNSLEELKYFSDEEPVITQRSLYLEPPDVQRQLDHYSLMAEAGSASNVNMQEPRLDENSLLHCEFCNFTTEHFSSIRRHILNRHGKKIHRCRDCNFFSGSRKTLAIHIEAGHSTYQSEPTHQKDLRCPFCLYQTKNKNNMIDHIILHREERVVPIEVRRPQLSRYLQGIVFRCHKCTFTSASAENLCSHMAKHDEIKPYKCRLCYFDCTQLCDLEAHLCDKHQVVRNHALVGQVSLDQQQERVGRRPEEQEGQPLLLTDHRKRVEDIVELNTAEENNAGVRFGDGSDPKKERQMSENQPKPIDRKWLLLQQREEAAAHRQQIKALQNRMLNLEARVENDILRHILVLDEEGGLTSAQPKHPPDVRAEVTTPNVVKKNLKLENNIKPQECLILTPLKIKQNKRVDEESSGTSLIHCKEESIGCEELADPYGAMPVLENECLKDRPFICCKEEEDGGFEQTGIREEDNPLVLKGEKTKPITVDSGAVTAADGAADVQKQFPCELCGRNLTNSSELERHIVRHGI